MPKKFYSTIDGADTSRSDFGLDVWIAKINKYITVIDEPR
jgi:hypothetical protein